MFRLKGDKIDKPLESYLLATYEEEPFPYEWSERDLYEQIRKLILQYNQGQLDITIPSVEESQILRYESLKYNYLELLGQSNRLKSIIENAGEILDNGYNVSLADEIF